MEEKSRGRSPPPAGQFLALASDTLMHRNPVHSTRQELICGRRHMYGGVLVLGRPEGRTLLVMQ